MPQRGPWGVERKKMLTMDPSLFSSIHLKIFFVLFLRVDGECVEKSVEASIGQDNLINAHCKYKRSLI